jgi:flagellar basal-body rod protein FlgB
MKLNDISILSMFQRNMGWLTRNHDVIANNIANSDTPDFKAKELKSLDFDRMMRDAARPVSVAVTSRDHMVGSGGGSNHKVRVDRDTYEVSSTGNSVTLEEQAVNIADNSMKYQLASSLYGKSVAMLRMAINQRR